MSALDVNVRVHCMRTQVFSSKSEPLLVRLGVRYFAVLRSWSENVHVNGVSAPPAATTPDEETP